MEISQLRSGWAAWENDFRTGRHGGMVRMFSSVLSGRYVLRRISSHVVAG